MLVFLRGVLWVGTILEQVMARQVGWGYSTCKKCSSQWTSENCWCHKATKCFKCVQFSTNKYGRGTSCLPYSFVVVATNDIKNSASFWVLMCTKKLHMVIEEKHIDAHGQMFLYCSQVFIGKYFKQQGRSLYSYVQYDIGETYIYSHLIRPVKF